MLTAALFEEIGRRDLGLKLGACLRADTAARFPELVDHMVGAGLALVNMGFESYTDGGLSAVGKGENSREFYREVHAWLARWLR